MASASVLNPQARTGPSGGSSNWAKGCQSPAGSRASNRTVLTAPQRRAEGSRRSIMGTARSLWGTVRLTPMNRIAPAPARAAASWSGGTSKAR